MKIKHDSSDLYLDNFYGANFDDVFDVINEELFTDFGNIACYVFEILTDQARLLGLIKSSDEDLFEIDEAEKKLEKMQSQITEMFSEYESASEKFKVACKFIWDFDRDYFEDQIHKYLKILDCGMR